MIPAAVLAQGTVIDPSRIGREIQGVDPAAPTRGVGVPPSQPGFTIDPAVAGRTVTVNRVILEGVTVFKVPDLEGLFAGVINRTVTLGEIGQVIDGIARKYGDAGYVFYNVVLPNQDFADDVIRIIVIEGVISRIDVAGAGIDPGVVRRVENILGKLRGQRPLRRAQLERYLLLANDLPGVKLAADVEPDGTGQAGALKLVVQPTVTHFEGIAQIDNYQNLPGDSLNFRIGGVANSVLGLGDSTEMRWLFSTPWDTLHVFDLRHAQSVSSEGDRIDAIVQYVDQRPKTVINGSRIDFRGKSLYTRAQYRYPVIRGVVDNLTAFGAIDYIDVNYKIEGIGLNGDSLRVARAGLVYGTTDAWQGQWNATAVVSIGLDAFDARAEGRPGADASFQKFNINLQRVQPLFGSDAWLLIGRAAAQVATGTVPNAEVFAYGGREYGRPFATLESVGDYGIAAAGEIRWRPPIDFVSRDIFDQHLYVFADYGRLWSSSRVNRPFFKEGASAGGGLRIKLFERLSGELEAAKPLAGRTATRDDDQRKWQFFVRLGASF